MAQVTLQNIFDGVRSKLSDTDVTGGTFATNAAQAEHFVEAYARMFDAMGGVDSERVRREFYYNLQANQEFLDPVSIGILDLAEPEEVEERGNVTLSAIFSTGTTSPIHVVTSAAHGLSELQEVVISGVTATSAPWGKWYMNNVTSNTGDLIGSVSDGVAGANGILSTSPERFLPVDPVNRAIDLEHTITDRLLTYFWHKSAFYFRGANTLRQIRVSYIASGTAPTNPNASLGIDDCRNFLVAYTAGSLATAKGWPYGDALMVTALGSKREADGSGGLLRDFLNIQVKKKQRLTNVKRPFRRRRNVLGGMWFS